MLILKKSNNGLGNIIYQILNILYEADNEKQQINLHELKKKGKRVNRSYRLLKILDLDKIENNFNKIYSKNNIIKKSDFFPRNLHNINKRIINVAKYFELGELYIKPFLNLSECLDERICIIHIRSGDIMGKNSHSLYVLPPLNYYIKIINEYDNKYDKFIVMTEPDMLNPCIQKLKEYSNKIEIRSKSAEEDYIYFLRAQTIVLSWSTFSDTTVYLSPNLKNLFFWNDSHVFSDKSVLPKHLNVQSIKLTKPYIERGKWNATDKKCLKLMLEYKLEDVIIEDN